MIKYIFCINPGRAGSNYLQHIFEHAEGVGSYHEAAPILNGAPMIDFLNGKTSKIEALMPSKITAIKNALTDTKKIYAETNHTFIKGFGWLLPSYIPQEEIGIVILKRDKELIAKSLHRIKCDSFNNNGRGWLIHINAKIATTALPAHVKFPTIKYYYYRVLYRFYYFVRSRPWLQSLSLGILKNIREPKPPYELNLEFLKWYVDETYALAEKYQKKFPNIRYYEISLDDLNDTKKVLAMFHYFGLRAKDTLGKVIGKAVNLKQTFT